MKGRDSGALSLDAIMREVRETLDRPAVAPPVAPAAEENASRRLDETLARWIWRRA